MKKLLILAVLMLGMSMSAQRVYIDYQYHPQSESMAVTHEVGAGIHLNDGATVGLTYSHGVATITNSGYKEAYSKTEALAFLFGHTSRKDTGIMFKGGIYYNWSKPGIEGFKNQAGDLGMGGMIGYRFKRFTPAISYNQINGFGLGVGILL